MMKEGGRTDGEERAGVGAGKLYAFSINTGATCFLHKIVQLLIHRARHCGHSVQDSVLSAHLSSAGTGSLSITWLTYMGNFYG